MNRKLFEVKNIQQEGKTFLIRISFPLRNGSVKIHFIMKDDEGEAHSHPWDYKSFLAIGAYCETVDGVFVKHLPFEVVRRKHEQKHKITLYRFLGIPLPVITIGLYSRKKVLCSLCTELGYCRTEGKPESLAVLA